MTTLQNYLAVLDFETEEVAESYMDVSHVVINGEAFEIIEPLDTTWLCRSMRTGKLVELSVEQMAEANQEY